MRVLGREAIARQSVALSQDYGVVGRRVCSQGTHTPFVEIAKRFAIGGVAVLVGDVSTVATGEA